MNAVYSGIKLTSYCVGCGGLGVLNNLRNNYNKSIILFSLYNLLKLSKMNWILVRLKDTILSDICLNQWNWPLHVVLIPRE